MESGKTVLMNVFTEQLWICRHTEQALDRRGKGRVGQLRQKHRSTSPATQRKAAGWWVKPLLLTTWRAGGGGEAQEGGTCV